MYQMPSHGWTSLTAVVKGIINNALCCEIAHLYKHQ